MTKPDIIRIAQAIFTVKDLNASREFYVDLLGMNILHEQSDALYLRGVEDREWTLKLEKCKDGEEARIRHLGYRVRDEQALDGLLALRVRGGQGQDRRLEELRLAGARRAEESDDRVLARQRAPRRRPPETAGDDHPGRART